MYFSYEPCGKADLPVILDMQRQAHSLIRGKSMLRENSVQMLESCLLPPNVTLGAWDGGTLAGFFILYFPRGEEALAPILPFAVRVRAANAKLCIVRPEYRGNHLQVTLGRELEKFARASGVGLLCMTVSPQNTPSVKNALRLGYTPARRIEKYGGVRDLYYKYL